MSELLHFTEHSLQEIALVFMASVYILRIRWIMRYPASIERQHTTGSGNTSPLKGSLYSLANILMPWGMESTRTKPLMYIQFCVFHLGVIAAISLSFIIPYVPELLNNTSLVLFLQVLTGAAFIVGIMRIKRRISNMYIRAISSPDDYFSLLLITVWFAFAFLSAPNKTLDGEWHILTYFILTAFFLVYVPFSKISHYLYYPFARYYIGKSLGRRGVFPIMRTNKKSAVSIQKSETSLKTVRPELTAEIPEETICHQ